MNSFEENDVEKDLIEGHDGDDEEILEEMMLDNMPMQVDEKVYIGSIDAAWNVAGLAQKGIQVVMSLLSGEGETMPVYDQENGLIKHEQFVMRDDHNEVLILHLPRVVDCIQRHVESGQKILVHCWAGRSRSAAAIIAWMSVAKGLSIDQALEDLRMVRPWVGPNSSFMKSLYLFEQTCRLSFPLKSLLDPSPILELCPLLPRLDFAEEFVSAILKGTKSATLRALQDQTQDKNSSLQDLFLHSLCLATTTNPKSQLKRGFAVLRIDAMDVYEMQELNDRIVDMEGLGSKSELHQVLLHFYPELTKTSKLQLYQFTVLNSNVAFESHETPSDQT